MDSERLKKTYADLINGSYVNFLRRFGIDKLAAKAQGATITDCEGTTYIDCVGGYGLFNLGHNHPRIMQALKEQIDSEGLFTRPLINEIQIKLAEKLVQVTPEELSCSFICNSGSEAIDSVIKLARLCTGKSEIIAAENSFHGFTFGALSASGISSFKKQFEPMLPGIVHVPYGDFNSLEKAVTEETAAILLEPIQHEAGIAIPDIKYFQKVRELCHQSRILLIFDEIKTGIGKTGRLFAIDHLKLCPDVLVLGKALGGGLMPIGAVIANKHLWRRFSFSFSMSASSFAGNALASRVALETLEVITNSNIIEDCKQLGLIIINKLNNIKRSHPEVIKSANGLGLLIGIHTINPKVALDMIRYLVRNRVLALPAFGDASVVMLEPPLVITRQQIDRVLNSIERFCQNQ